MIQRHIKITMMQTVLLFLCTMCHFGKAWAQKDLPYEYGFEIGSLSTEGWIATVSASSSGVFSSGAQHSGSYGFAFYFDEQDASLVSPLLVSDNNSIEVSFWYKEYVSAYGNEQFQVGYTTDENVTDASEFIYGDVISASTTWQQYVNIFPAGTKRIAIKYIFTNGYYLFLDDFKFEVYSSCSKPTGLTVNYNEKTNSARVTWSGESDSYNINVNGTVTKGVSSPYTITDIAPSTKYTIKVQGDCGNEQSGWVVTSFFSPIGMPYRYGFEDSDEFDLWTTEGQISLTDDEAYVRTDAFCAMFNYTTDPPQYLVSPLLGGITNGLHVEFYYRQFSQGVETFQVGYSTTDNSPENFIWGEEITASPRYQRFSANYPANTKYVAIRHTSNDQYYLFVDDFVFEESASCLEPSGVKVSDQTLTGATLTWTAGGNETAWDVYITTDEADVPDDTTAPTVADVSTNPYNLTGLTPGTIYYVYVRAIKGAEMSAWSTPAKFNTKCEPTSLPYSYGFEDAVLPVSWSAVNTNTSYCNIEIMDEVGKSGNNALTYYIGASNGTVATVLPEIDTDNYPLNECQITFDACFANDISSSMTNGKLAVGIMTNPNDISTFVLVKEIDITTEYNNYESYTVRFDNYTGTGRFVALKNVYTQLGYILIDNVTVSEIPSCLPPTDLQNDAVTQSTVTLSWTNGDENQDTWQICINGDEDNLIIADSNPFTVTGLKATTTYTAKVRAYCSSTDQSMWSKEISFVTAAETVTTFPWKEDFNSLTLANSIPNGWNNDDGTVTGIAYKWCYNTYSTSVGGTNGTSYDDSNCLRFNSFNSASGKTNFLKTVPLALPSDTEMQLTFWYKNPAGGDFSVFISTDNGATYETALATGLTKQATWTQIDPIFLSEYAGQTVVIVFKGTSNYGNGDAYIYLDDVTVEKVPSCAAPNELTATDITASTATLGWTANNGETEWTLYYKKSTDTDYTEVTNVTENPYTLTGLDANTKYQFYVTALCSVTEKSVASSVYNFTTDCVAIVVDAENPFFEGFEGTTFVPNCWQNIVSDNNQWKRVASYIYPTHTGSASAHSGYYGTIYLMLPDLQIADDAVLSFWSYNLYVNDYVKNSVVLIDGDTETELWSPDNVTGEWINTIIDLTAYKGQTVSLAFKYEGNNAHDWFIDDVEVFVPTDIVLADENTDNSSVINQNNGKVVNVTLSGRTLWADGDWNTLTLPFNVTIADSPLAGATAKNVVTATIDGTMLNVTFSDAVEELLAGVPYIIKWTGDNITDPVFHNVVINSTANNFDNGLTDDTRVQFMGTYNSIVIDNQDKSILFMGNGSNLYYPDGMAQSFIDACRAYFKIGNEDAGARIITDCNIDFGEGQATAIKTVGSKPPYNDNDAWYTIDGCKLNGMPTKKGVYINNKHKIIIK